MNGARTTLEVRMVHCIGSVLDLEAVYTLTRSTRLVLVVEWGNTGNAGIVLSNMSNIAYMSAGATMKCLLLLLIYCPCFVC